jgi:hypothetical protein
MSTSAMVQPIEPETCPMALSSLDAHLLPENLYENQLYAALSHLATIHERIHQGHITYSEYYLRKRTTRTINRGIVLQSYQRVL